MPWTSYPCRLPFALAESAVTTDDCCTKRGFISLVCADGSVYWQICFYCANVVETIISPQAVLASSDVFHTWTQTGYKDGRIGSIRFDRADDFLSMHLPLDYHDGLYYCTTDVLTVDPDEPTVDSPKILRVALPVTPSALRCPSRYPPVSKSKQL